MTARTRAYRARIPRVVIRRWRRYRACGVVGIEPQFRTWDGSGEVVSFVVSLNLHRRHLDESQRALVAARIATLAQGQRADSSIELSSVTQQDAAAASSSTTLSALGGHAAPVCKAVQRKSKHAG